MAVSQAVCRGAVETAGEGGTLGQGLLQLEWRPLEIVLIGRYKSKLSVGRLIFSREMEGISLLSNNN